MVPPLFILDLIDLYLIRLILAKYSDTGKRPPALLLNRRRKVHKTRRLTESEHGILTAGP